MTEYVTVYGFCCGCGSLISFHPNKVPSIRVNGTKEPVCRNCIEAANAQRVAEGGEPFVIDPDAYEACPAHEL